MDHYEYYEYCIAQHEGTLAYICIDKHKVLVRHLSPAPSFRVLILPVF